MFSTNGMRSRKCDCFGTQNPRTIGWEAMAPIEILNWKKNLTDQHNFQKIPISIMNIRLFSRGDLTFVVQLRFWKGRLSSDIFKYGMCGTWEGGVSP